MRRVSDKRDQASPVRAAGLLGHGRMLGGTVGVAALRGKTWREVGQECDVGFE